MKKLLQRWLPFSPALERLLLLSLFFAYASVANAQFLPPSVSYPEYTYPPVPPPPPVAATTNSSNYSLQGNWPPSATNCWLLVSSWEGSGLAGFSWQALDYATFAVYDQGYLNYPSGATDLNVGIIRNPTSPTFIQVDVSYHLHGTGHFVDVYDWHEPATLGGLGPYGCTLNFSKQLSCLPAFSRISMDTHIGYGTAIVWEDPSNGIDVIAGNDNVFGPAFTFSGTSGHTNPDVAFTHAGGSVQQIHVVSYLSGTGVVEYYANWPDIIPGGALATLCGTPPFCSTCSLANTIEDVNAIPVNPQSLHFDAPDHYTFQDWAYTYAIGNDIYARIMNWDAGAFPMPSYLGTPATVCFTDGSYVAPVYPPGLPVIDGSVNSLPVIAWDNHFITGNPSFYVAWHTAYSDPSYNPSSDAYIAIQIEENGLISDPHMPYNFFGASLVPSNISPSPTIALSKQNDQSPRLYETFAEMSGGAYDMRHRLIQWSSGTFKPGSGSTVTTEPELTISPNPFTDKLHINFPENMEMTSAKVKVTDMNGREMGFYNNAIFGVDQFLSGVARKLIPGNYLINVSCDQNQIQKVFKVTKVN